MAVNINASTSSGIGLTSDNSGVIQFQSNGSNTVNFAANGTLTASNVTTTGRVTAGNVTISSGGSITFPDATTQNTAGISESMTLLGTIVTTSGNTATLSNLTLTGYKQLQFVFQAVSSNSSTQLLYFGVSNYVILAPKLTAATDVWAGIATVDLTNGFFAANIQAVTPGTTYSGNNPPYGGKTDMTTASTSVSVNNSTGAFDAGSVLVYGVK